MSLSLLFLFLFFFFTATATPEIYTLSLHDALPIWVTALGLLQALRQAVAHDAQGCSPALGEVADQIDRKSTRLNSSHLGISYAVFCLKKKKKIKRTKTRNANKGAKVNNQHSMKTLQ